MNPHSVSRAGGPVLDTAPPGIRPSVWAHMPWPARRAWIERHGLQQTRRRLAVEKHTYPWTEEDIRAEAERILADMTEEQVDGRRRALDQPRGARADIGSVLNAAEKADGWTEETVRIAERRVAHGCVDEHSLAGRQVYRRCLERLRAKKS